MKRDREFFHIANNQNNSLKIILIKDQSRILLKDTFKQSSYVPYNKGELRF